MTSDNKIFDKDETFSKAKEFIDFFLDRKNIFAPKHISDARSLSDLANRHHINPTGFM